MDFANAAEFAESLFFAMTVEVSYLITIVNLFRVSGRLLPVMLA